MAAEPESPAALLADLPVVELGDQLRGMIPHIREALEKGEENEAHLRGLVEKQRAENVRMRRALTVVDPDYEPPAQPKKKKGSTGSRIGSRTAGGTATGYGITVEKAVQVAEKAQAMMKENKSEFITQPEMIRTMKWDQGKVSSAFRFLRDAGFFRNAGRDPESARDRWAIMDAKVLDNLKKQIGAK